MRLLAIALACLLLAGCPSGTSKKKNLAEFAERCKGKLGASYTLSLWNEEVAFTCDHFDARNITERKAQ